MDRYWKWVRVDSLGNCRTDEIEQNRVFFVQQFPETQVSANMSDREIQSQLMHWYKSNDVRRQLAEDCLRCFISQQIKENCLMLEQKFCKNHDFTSAELFPLVLDSRNNSPHPESLTTQILNKFNPEISNLSSWTVRMFKSNRAVKQFLLEHGIEQVTDWMILNYMTSGRLERMLENQQRTKTEIKQALQLLNSYHQVYRTYLMQHRQPGSRRKYPEMGGEQLHQIAELCRNASYHLSPEEVRKKLQNLAKLVREERIISRRGKSRIESLNQSQNLTYQSSSEDNEIIEFLERYSEQRDICLNNSANQVIQARYTYLQRSKTEYAIKRARKYLKALDLFHCQGVAMTEIAPELELKDQPQVSRLLELKNLRKDIGRNTVLCLKKHIYELVKYYATPQQIKELDTRLNEILEQQIDVMIQDAEQEASNSQNRMINSLIALTICQQVQQIIMNISDKRMQK